MHISVQQEAFDLGAVSADFAGGHKDMGAIVTFTGVVRDLPDDPADHRGILSWHAQLRDRKLREAGSYGYLVSANLPAEDVVVSEQLPAELNYLSSVPAAVSLELSRTDLSVRKVFPSGRAVDHQFNPFWTRFVVDRHDDDVIRGLLCP